MKLAAIQFRPIKGDWGASAAALCALVEDAARQGAFLIVCPEMALTGYLFADPDAARDVAERAEGGRTSRLLAPLCRAFGCQVVIGYPEIDPDEPDRLYNAALVLAEDGRVRCSYRKRLLYELDETWASPGDRPYPLLDTPAGRMTVGICMDLNDDRFVRFLHLDRPHVVAFCTNWIHQGVDIRPYWRHRLRGAPCYFVAADTYGHETAAAGAGPPLSAHFLGHSAVLDPRGRTLALAEETGDAVLLVDIPTP